ncbi:MAG: alpha/beta hydrolase [Crocinitomicaceae bacterium]|nr:alpha/beta hydrolase [Flavobacteriales bacterium]NQZ35848.1 alpha/beta hydrolase [Crocinitomicaceae bacterium]
MRKLNYTFKNSTYSEEIPLVLLHGFLESSSMWEHVELPEGYPAVLIDLPGHGKSNHPELICDSIAEMANMVIDVVDELQLTQFHVIGHSMGGYIGLEIKKNDLRAEKIMLLNSNFWSDSPQKVKDRIRVAEIVQTNQSHFIYEVIPNLFLNPQDFDREVKTIISEALEMSPDAIGKASIAMSKRKDYSSFVREQSADFTCIQGIEDSIVPVKQMRESLEGSQVNYIEIEEVGHVAHFEASEKLNALIDNFLK